MRRHWRLWLGMAIGTALLGSLTIPAGATDVTPNVVVGNPNCTTIGSTAPEEFKVDPASAGIKTDPETGVQFSLTLTNGGRTLDYTVLDGAAAADVIVKGGTIGANHYDYMPEPGPKTSDTGLTAPVATPQPRINHVIFCYFVVPPIPPVANDDTASVVAGGSVVIDVLANDTDANGDPLTIDSFTQGTNGAVTQVTGGLQYAPNVGFSGATDTFTYTISDGNGGTDTATVTVTVFEGVITCPGTTGLVTDTSGMSAQFFRQGDPPCGEAKPFIVNFDPSAGANGEIEFLIDPAFTEDAEYTAKLTFDEFSPVGNPNGQTFLWDLDNPGTLTAADWCTSAVFDGSGNLTSAVPPGTKDGCIASQTTQTVGPNGEAQTTWWVYFRFDLKTRG